MAPSPLAKREKQKVWKKLHEIVGPTVHAGRQQERQVTADNRISVRLAFSAFIEKYGWYFFGFTIKDIELAREFEHSFIVFTLDSSDDTLVVPLEDIYSELVQSSTGNDSTNYKVHIFDDFQLEGPNKLNLRKYHNRYQLLKDAAHSTKRRSNHLSTQQRSANSSRTGVKK